MSGVQVSPAPPQGDKMKAWISKGAIRLIAENEIDEALIRTVNGRIFIGEHVVISSESGFGEVYLMEAEK